MAGGGQQLGGRGVVEDAGQRLFRDREVTVEDQLAGWTVGSIPRVQAVEEAAELAEAVTDGVPM
ncbi:hypothetical protein GCM10023083_29280 [Streptomyces phyllanthi]